MNYILNTGLPGTGKSLVGDILAVHSNGRRISTDEVRNGVEFSQSAKRGQKFRSNDRWIFIRHFCYQTLCSMAERWNDASGSVMHDIITASPYITLSRNEKARFSKYLQKTLGTPFDTLIFEAPFNLLEYLDMFYTRLKPQPHLIHVKTGQKEVLGRLRERSAQATAESIAGTGVYKGFLKGYRTPQDMGYPVTVIDNTLEIPCDADNKLIIVGSPLEKQCLDFIRKKKLGTSRR